MAMTWLIGGSLASQARSTSASGVPPSPPFSRIEMTSIGICPAGSATAAVARTTREFTRSVAIRQGMPTDAKPAASIAAPGGPSVSQLGGSPSARKNPVMMATLGRGVARDRRGGHGQVAAHMGDERADVALLDVVTGEVLDFGDRAFDSTHANGSGPSML